LVIGGGGIAIELLRLLRPFEVRTVVVRRCATPVDGADRVVDRARMAAELADTDVVFLAAALTPETFGIVGAAELDRLPSHAVVVNIGRGALLDTDAVVQRLADGRLGGVALDVTEPEPLPDGHPLWRHPRALVTPHTACPPDLVRELAASRVRENVSRALSGAPLLGVVDPVHGY
jgi:phosphoglycerate dehydrogenase-like enzyme